MNTIYILPIEPISNRYPGDWHTNIPLQLKAHVKDKFEVVSIDGEFQCSNTGKTNFLNFTDTNAWKSSQMEKVSRMFSDNKIKNGDVFLITDAWNPTVNQLRYMVELTGLDVKLVGVWHAGAYDPHDILGQTVKDKSWAHITEASMYNAFDVNIFSTGFHRTMFLEQVSKYAEVDSRKAVKCGFPMEYMKIPPKRKKTNTVIFPHRKSPEKQYDIAKDLQCRLAYYGIDVFICSDENLTNEEYYDRLTSSKICFSASLQETLGIAQFEGMLAGAAPLVPCRLSYAEMYQSQYLYPSYWSENYEEYLVYREEIIRIIVEKIRTYDYDSVIADSKKISEFFFNGEDFYNIISGV